MERIIYVIGAGFSAPLGLPLVSNFLGKAKDLHYSGNSRFGYFKDVLKTIERLSVAKNYYRADLSNIEEILSIVEMEQTLGGKRDRDAIVRFIKDVIYTHTPEMSHPDEFPGNWNDFVFGKNQSWRPYGAFVAGIMNLAFREGTVTKDGNVTRSFSVSQRRDPEYSYGIVTLNYDRVVETVIQFIRELYSFSNVPSEKIQFSNSLSDIPIAKLHGTVDGILVPPTWNKAFDSAIIPEWEKAFGMIKTANHIRFLGYSLPEADAYVKYLLKAAVLETENLKTIDVVCLDRDGSVKARYDSFVDFGGYKFLSEDINSILSEISNVANGEFRNERKVLGFNRALESIHANHFSRQ